MGCCFTPWVETHGYKYIAPNGAEFVCAEKIEIVAEMEFCSKSWQGELIWNKSGIV
jgi:hypothetical protein